MLAPDVPEIERTLDALLQKDASARVLAMRSPVRRPWPDVIERNGKQFRILWCLSELEIRERLNNAEDANTGGVILLTPLEPTLLSDDVMARFPRGRLEQTDRWTALRGAFRARDVDPRLRSYKWLADLLLEQVPAGRGYAPAASGVLDLETAWRAVLCQVLNLPEGRPDAAALLDWSMDATNLDRFTRLTEAAKRSIIDRISSEGGPAARLALAAAAAGRGADALPFALVCGVVFGQAEPQQILRDASVRLEPLVGHTRIAPEAARALAEAGRRVLDRTTRDMPDDARAIEARAESILREIHADTAASLSSALSLGLNARISEAAEAIVRFVETQLSDDAELVWNLAQKAVAHDRAAENRARVDRLVMAARLCRWQTSRPVVTWRNILEAATAYVSDGAFVDRARQAVRSGDQLPDVATAYAQLAEAITKRREDENRGFAMTLKEWNANGSLGDAPLPIERVLTKVVAPLAQDAPVLLLVLDGLSFPVWRTLAETVRRLGWSEIVEESRSGPVVAVAALPTVTQVSRASLLCGALTIGNQSRERSGFTSHAGLVAASRFSFAPRLFHKADLGSGPELGADVREAVADPRQRVVCVVHNAVDAQLSGSDQLDLTWSAEGLRQVASLFHAARGAGRIVVVTGDHGHVLDEETTQARGGSGDRWRASDETQTDGEIVLAGGRVLSPIGGNSIVAAWSERVRFATRRNGYHGGVSPQEALVPVAVLGPGNAIAGWKEAPAAEPNWWRGSQEEVSPINIAPGLNFPLPQRRRHVNQRQTELFAGCDQTQIVQSTLAHAGPLTGWMERLFASEIYAGQKRLAGRGAPHDDKVRDLLVALAARGGRMTRAGLSQSIGIPEFRLGGLVSAARRVLNLDQAQILWEEGDDIVFSESLLRAQFGLGAVA